MVTKSDHQLHLIRTQIMRLAMSLVNDMRAVKGPPMNIRNRQLLPKTGSGLLQFDQEQW
jgi:hypothetical protein